MPICKLNSFFCHVYNKIVSFDMIIISYDSNNLLLESKSATIEINKFGGDKVYLSFAEQVRVILRQRDMTIEQLADILNVSRQNLNQQLNRSNFNEQTMRNIAIALNCDFFTSLGGINVGGLQVAQPIQNAAPKRNPGRPTSSDKPKEKQPKAKEIKINPKYADIAKYIEENNNKPGMDVFDEDYPEHIPGTKVAVDEYSKWKLDLFNRPEIPVPDEDLLPPDNIYQWRIYRSATGERSWEFAYSSPPDPRTYWGSGPTIDYPSANHTVDDPRNYSGALKL